MNSVFYTSLFLALSLTSLSSFAYTTPDYSITPGQICSEDNPDFDRFDYSEQIARCKRNVNKSKKIKIADLYGGIDQSEWPNYEFDHFIPLCAGGSNDISNLWPQPLDEANEKDVIENRVCNALRQGNMSQEEAISTIYNWFESKNNF